ncbi:hypothetical protein V4C53_43550 [Paraburkholderia azotifigens]|uniref:hypothetical protein n=1 Tax=Paraburkholderia azotifigens TaxID=2057004 RepID=UPI0031798E86
MNTLTCPHCHSDVPRGASVCRGRQAEITYGPEHNQLGALLVPAAFVGYKVRTLLPDSMAIAAWIVGAGVFIGLIAFIKYACRDRVSFKRAYKTKR